MVKLHVLKLQHIPPTCTPSSVVTRIHRVPGGPVTSSDRHVTPMFIFTRPVYFSLVKVQDKSCLVWSVTPPLLPGPRGNTLVFRKLRYCLLWIRLQQQPQAGDPEVQKVESGSPEVYSATSVCCSLPEEAASQGLSARLGYKSNTPHLSSTLQLALLQQEGRGGGGRGERRKLDGNI